MESCCPFWSWHLGSVTDEREEYIGASVEGGKICAPILRKKVKLTQARLLSCM